ncbi:MAG: ATP-binding protein [Deltaproteobacteria bacterium]|nr:ATP-binding protein [Deltaproteobacteria bacterium]
MENKKIAKELIAFSNHKGGYLFLGVDDNRKIIGFTSF